MAQHPISIVGAGIGGLTLARCLLKHGIPMILYDRNSSPPRQNYGITLHPSSYRPLLNVLDIDESTFKRRTAVDSSIGGNGRINSQAVLQSGNLEANSFRVHRGNLEELLREGLDIRWEHALDKVEETSSGLSLCLESGQKIETQCVIGVDGPHSNIRKSCLPDTPLKVLPYVAFNGKRRVERELFDRVYAPFMKDSSVLERRRGEVALKISVDEKKDDLVSISWVYSRPAHGSSDVLFKPNRSTSDAKTIPDEFFQEVGSMQELEMLFEEIFDIKILKSERILSWLMRTIVVDLPKLQDVAKKGIFFMGDAIHAEPILGGEGANAAICDGVELADLISSDGIKGISAWYDQKHSDWQNGVSKSESAIAIMHNQEKRLSL